jgi:hypothetical protein
LREAVFLKAFFVTVHGCGYCHSEGAIFSEKKGDRRISPLSLGSAFEQGNLCETEARFFTALRSVQDDILAKSVNRYAFSLRIVSLLHGFLAA